MITSVAHSEPSQTAKTKIFKKIINGGKPLTIFAWSSILIVWLGSKYASEHTLLY